MRITTRRTLAVVAVVVAGLALTGCAGRPGAAAFIDGERVATADVDRTVRELSPYFSGASARNVVAILAEGAVLSGVAADHGVEIADTQIDELFAQAVATTDGAEAEVPVLSAMSRQIIRVSLEWQTLQQSEDGTAILTDVTARIGELDLDLNPRFGELADGNVPVDTTHGWIAVDAAVAG